MTTQLTLRFFGSTIPVHRGNHMARNIARGIRGSDPIPFAGFVWYGSEGIVRNNPQTIERLAA